MSSARDYRVFAAECVLLAEEARTAQDRVRLLTMAERWMRLAVRAERAHAYGPPAPFGGRGRGGGRALNAYGYFSG